MKKREKMKVDPRKEQKWNQALIEVKQIKATMKLPQLQIAELALSVCEITWGGAKKEIRNNPYTLTKFAEKAGISAKSLSNWVAAYRNVYARTPRHLRNKLNYTDICSISKGVNRETPVDEVTKKVAAYLEEDSFEHKIGRYLKHLRGLCYNFERNAATFKVNEKILAEVSFYCTSILKNIHQDAPNIKAKNSNQARAYDTRNMSAARAVLGDRAPKKIKENSNEMSKL